MNDDRLRELLEAVPRDVARDGFTEATIRRARERRTSRRRLPLVAAASLVIALGGAAFAVREIGELREERRIEALRAEQRAIAAELAELKAMRRDPAIVYVGGDESVDVVLDLSRRPQRAGVRTVSWD